MEGAWLLPTTALIFRSFTFPNIWSRSFIFRSSPGEATMLLYEEAIACMKKTNQVGTFSFKLAPELIDLRQNIVRMKRTNQVRSNLSQFLLLYFMNLYWTGWSFLGDERNFALESYGPGKHHHWFWSQSKRRWKSDEIYRCMICCRSSMFWPHWEDVGGEKLQPGESNPPNKFKAKIRF